MSIHGHNPVGPGCPYLRQRHCGSEQSARVWVQERIAEGAVGWRVVELEWARGFWEAVAYFLDRADLRREVVWLPMERHAENGMDWMDRRYTKGATHE